MYDSSKVRPSFNSDRQELGKILPLHTPFTVILDPGDLCNFRCSYCFRSRPQTLDCGYYHRGTVMPEKIFRQAADQLCGFPEAPKTISLSNHGEPLCNPALPAMVAYIKQTLALDAHISIHTNASLLDRRMAEGLARAGLDRMVVSVQGMDAEGYRKTCGARIDFDQFLRQLEYFYSIKETTEVCVKIVDVALQGSEQDFYECFSPMADRVFVEKVLPIWGENTADLHMNKYGVAFPRVACCVLLFHTLVVTPRGEILPCTHLHPASCLGHVSETTLVQAWNGPVRKKLLRQMLQHGLTGNSPCNTCQKAQNSIYSNKDIIDDHRTDILQRLGNDDA